MTNFENFVNSQCLRLYWIETVDCIMRDSDKKKLQKNGIFLAQGRVPCTE